MRVVAVRRRPLPRGRARRRQGRVAGPDGRARAAGAARLRRPGRRASPTALPDGGAELRALLARAAARRASPPVADAGAGARRRGRAGGRRCARRSRRPTPPWATDDAPVAVRSSACAEDSETASFAGQQETYLHVRGASDVLRRIRDCWASFFTERALFYRSRKGALDDLGMAVVVQRMVDADVAGVLFTIDPTRGRRDRMIVEAVFGLGEAVVSGQVTPDHYVLARDGRLKKSRLTTQPYAVVRDPAGGVPRGSRCPRSRAPRRRSTRTQLAQLAARRPRPRGAARPPAGHRVGDRGRRAVRAPGPPRDRLSRAQAAAPPCASAARRCSSASRSSDVWMMSPP